MALSKIGTLDTLNALIRVLRTASMEIQYATPAAVHRKQQALHVTSVRRYPDPPILDLPNNVCDIFANETGRFTPERVRDIALYAEKNGDAIMSAVNCSGFPKIHDDGHVDSYDCFGAISLNGTMQSNVPKPFSSHGRSMHLNMPGGQWSRDGTTTNAFLMSPFLRATCWPSYIVKMCYSTDNCQTSKDAKKDQGIPLANASMSKRDKFHLMLRDYGGTLLAFHITISLISLGCCYMVIISGIDVMPFTQKWTGGNEQIDKVLKTSTDFVIAYTVHKLLAPIRISISLTVTPVIVRHLRRIGLLKMPKVKPSS
ncbi:uncharacterized protein [Anoplolepis gracilipes]|uniref:uncharacterized protein isoform X2 n=1 Tax=Anoplolepis gracilipes TaxID=354296 RepID=UPI003B9EF48C